MMSKAVRERKLAEMRERQLYGDQRLKEARKGNILRAHEASLKANRGKRKPELIKCNCGDCKTCRQRNKRRMVVQTILAQVKRESYLMSRGSAYDRQDFRAPGITSQHMREIGSASFRRQR